MAQPGEVIENPIHSTRIVFRKTEGQTEGASVEMDFFMAPGGSVGGAHIHAIHRERMTVVSGTFHARLGKRRVMAGPGETIDVPAGSVHDLWNEGSDEAHLILELMPGAKAAELFETIYGLARDGKLKRNGRPRLLQGAVIAKEYAAYLPRPAVSIQKPGVALLAAVGGLLGRRPRYERYSAGGM